MSPRPRRLIGALTLLALFGFTPRPSFSDNAAPPVIEAFFMPFHDGRAAVLAELDRAAKSVHVAQYNIRDEVYAAKLLELKARGVEVKVVIDAKNAAQDYNTLDDVMQSAGLDVTRKTMGGRYGIMHHKFTVIDGRVVLTGSFNWNNTARLSNNENMVIVRDAVLAADYEQEFAELLGAPEKKGSVAGLSSASRFQALFSPEDRVDKTLIALFDKAQSSVKVAVFSYRDRAVNMALERAARRGVKVELVTEFKQAANTPRDEYLARAGARVVVGENTNSTYAAMHHKYAIVDEEIVVTGACNWTYTAFFDSAEDILVIRDRAIAARYLADFADLLLRYDPLFSPLEAQQTRALGALHFLAEQGRTAYGDEVRVVGDHPALGSWNPARGVPLGTASNIFPRWSGAAHLPAGALVEYKYVIVKPDGRVIWERGANRRRLIDPDGRRETIVEAFRD